MNANQRRKWLQRREHVRDVIPADAMLGAFVAAETGWSTGSVTRVLSGKSVRHDIDEEIRAAHDELAPLIDAFYDHHAPPAPKKTPSGG